MRIAAKHRGDWVLTSHAFQGKQFNVRIAGEWVDVVQLGQGDPIVLVPGLAGGWKLLAPLATKLARHYQGTIPGLRGDTFPTGPASVRDMAEHARDLGSVIGQLGLERPTLFG